MKRPYFNQFVALFLTVALIGTSGEGAQVFVLDVSGPSLAVPLHQGEFVSQALSPRGTSNHFAQLSLAGLFIAASLAAAPGVSPNKTVVLPSLLEIGRTAEFSPSSKEEINAALDELQRSALPKQLQKAREALNKKLDVMIKSDKIELDLPDNSARELLAIRLWALYQTLGAHALSEELREDFDTLQALKEKLNTESKAAEELLPGTVSVNAPSSLSFKETRSLAKRLNQIKETMHRVLYSSLPTELSVGGKWNKVLNNWSLVSANYFRPSGIKGVPTVSHVDIYWDVSFLVRQDDQRKLHFLEVIKNKKGKQFIHFTGAASSPGLIIQDQGPGDQDPNFPSAIPFPKSRQAQMNFDKVADQPLTSASVTSDPKGNAKIERPGHSGVSTMARAAQLQLFSLVSLLLGSVFAFNVKPKDRNDTWLLFAIPNGTDFTDWSSSPYLDPMKLPSHELHISRLHLEQLERDGAVTVDHQFNGTVTVKFNRPPSGMMPLTDNSKTILDKSKDNWSSSDQFNPRLAQYARWVAQWSLESLSTLSDQDFFLQSSAADPLAVDVIGDADGNLEHLKTILRHAKARRVIILGDVIGRSETNEEALDWVLKFKHEEEKTGRLVELILGNAEWRYVTRRYLRMDQKWTPDGDTRERLSQKLRQAVLDGDFKMATVVGGRLATHITLDDEHYHNLKSLLKSQADDLNEVAGFLNQLLLTYVTPVRFLDKNSLPSWIIKIFLGNKNPLLPDWEPDEGTGRDYFNQQHYYPSIMGHVIDRVIRVLDPLGLVVCIDIGMLYGNLGFVRILEGLNGAEHELYSLYVDGLKIRWIEQLIHVLNPPPGHPHYRFIEKFDVLACAA